MYIFRKWQKWNKKGFLLFLKNMYKTGIETRHVPNHRDGPDAPAIEAIGTVKGDTSSTSTTSSHPIWKWTWCFPNWFRVWAVEHDVTVSNVNKRQTYSFLVNVFHIIKHQNTRRNPLKNLRRNFRARGLLGEIPGRISIKNLLEKSTKKSLESFLHEFLAISQKEFLLK